MRGKNLIGSKYGKLKVVKFNGKNKHNKNTWVCLCDCGKQIVCIGGDLTRGHTTSCGCSRRKHNLRDTRLYSIWGSMKNRCSSKNNSHYNYYGGAGITVCEEWSNDFIKFYNWAVNNGYSDELTLDRINPNGNYEPSNCRWANKTIQALNTKLDKRSTTGYTGVYLEKRTNKYIARITVNKKYVHLGTFSSKEEAIDARRKAEIEYFKDLL